MASPGRAYPGIADPAASLPRGAGQGEVVRASPFLAADTSSCLPRPPRCPGAAGPGLRPNIRPPRSGEVEAVEVHHLGPRRHEVAHELLLRVVAGVDLGQGAQLRVRAEDEVDARCRSTSARRSCGRGLRTRPRVLRTGFHSVPMSSRLTKKSLVSVPGRSVKTPCCDLPTLASEHAQAADQHRHLRRGQRQQLRLVDQQLLGRARLKSAFEVVAEAVGHRLEHGERLDVGLLLRGVRAARRERHRRPSWPAFFAACSTRGAAAEHDQVGERDLLAAGCARVELASGCPPASASTFASCAGWLTSQSFCGARRMRAPLAPPRLSEPRKVEAEAQAVETSCEIDRPEARIFAFSAAMSCRVDQRMVDRRDRVLPDQLLRRHLAGRGSGRAGPCRGGSA